ncbi:MAG: hypothetical protein HZC29_00620 [Thaumarchaeota archaeon]|nr:hypothetical protein [Nitrososphaerota archaeon]
MVENITWSDWLDYNTNEISKMPVEPGVYMMHAAMKILVIGSSENLRQTILESLNDSCANQLLKEYQEKHDGKLPKCMGY